MILKSGVTASSRSTATTISRRLAAASAAVIVVTVTAFVFFGIVRERGAIARVESDTAGILLDHLASMLGPDTDPDEACRVLASVGASEEARGRIQLVASNAESALKEGFYLAASRVVSLSSGKHRLEYYASEARLRHEVKVSVISHAVLGLAAVVWLIFAMEAILQRRIVEPLHQFAHQIRHMSRGGGWAPRVPDVDGELSELKESFSMLGPSLGDQVSEWIAVERRAAVALNHHALRQALRAEFDESRSSGAPSTNTQVLTRIEQVLVEHEDIAGDLRPSTQQTSNKSAPVTPTSKLHHQTEPTKESKS